eukprot:s34_g6.t1
MGKRLRCKQQSKVSAVNLPPGLQYGPRQAVGRAVAELTEVGFGRSRPVMDMGCAYHSFSKGELRVQLDLREFPEVMKLISSSMSSMTCHHPGIEGLNVIARHYEGPSEKDRLAFHADNFVVGEWVFGCILRQDAEDDALTLCFRERDGPREFCMKEEAGHLYRQMAEARHHWSHGIPAGGRGPVRQSLTWRWLRPTFLLWSALERRCDRGRQGRWLREFVAACQAAGIEHEVVQQFLQRWLPVCAPAAWEVPPPHQRKEGTKLPRTLQQRLERLRLLTAVDVRKLLESVPYGLDGFGGRDAGRIPASAMQGGDTDPKGPQNAVAEAVLYPDSQMTTSQLELALAEQQREMHMLVAHHYETARQMLVTRDQMTMACQIENQELRAQIGELRKNHSTTSAKSHKDQALVMRQHRQANKVMLKRDLHARKTEEENAMLRAKLVEMSSGRPVSARPGSDRSPMVRTVDPEGELSASGESGDESARHAMLIARSGNSERTVPDFAMQPSRPQSAPAPTGVNLLMSLKLPGQDSSDDESHELPPWDAELTKRPKKATAVMDMKELPDPFKGNSEQERMRQMFKNGPRSRDLYKEGGWCSMIAGHDYFETVVYCFIIANVVWLGIDAMVNPEDLLINAPAWIIVVENVFCIFFVGELAVRFGAYRSMWEAVRDPWIIIDSVLVLGMMLETWIFFVILQFAEVDFSLVDQSSLRLLRVLRVSRVARIVRILRALPELLILVKALGVATRSVFFTFCLLMLVIYLFALGCFLIGKETVSGEKYFNTLGGSMFTLFFYGLFGYDLPVIAEATFNDNLVLGIVFCMYLVCAPLTMMNLLVAVLVEVVGVLATAEQEMVNNKYEMDQMQMALKELDENGDEFISLEEFGKLMDKTWVEQNSTFGLWAQSLTFAEFTETALALRDANTATVRDINQLAKRMIAELRGTVGQLNSKMKEKTASKDKVNLKHFRKR